MRRRLTIAALLGSAALCAACGLQVQSPDLFLLTRTGGGSRLTLLVNDAGTVSCDGGPARPLPDPLLLEARDLATLLDDDAKAKLHIPAPRNSIYRYTVRLPDGTITFPDTAGSRRGELSQAELFALQTDQNACA